MYGMNDIKFIKIGLKETGWKVLDWINLAQHTEKWREIL
jgi:hypothetical protein